MVAELPVAASQLPVPPSGFWITDRPVDLRVVKSEAAQRAGQAAPGSHYRIRRIQRSRRNDPGYTDHALAPAPCHQSPSPAGVPLL